MGGRTEGEGQTTRNAKAGRAWSTFKAAERNKVINIIKKYDSRSYEATRATALIGINKYAERVYNAFLEGEVLFENKYNYDFTDLEKVKDALYDFIAENPKMRFSRVTPQQDADYLAAVERGDMETAQRMVDEAEKAVERQTPSSLSTTGMSNPLTPSPITTTAT